MGKFIVLLISVPLMIVALVCVLFYLKMVDYLKKALIYGHTSRISS